MTLSKRGLITSVLLLLVCAAGLSYWRTRPLSSDTSADGPQALGDHVAARPIIIGLLPDEDAAALLSRFEPVRLRLEKELGRPVHVRVPSLKVSYSYQDLVDQFVEGKVQVAYFGGLTYLQASAATPTAPLVQRQRDTNFRSYFIVRATEGVESIQGLRGLAFAFGSRSSTSGHLMPRHFLREHGIDPKKDFLGQPEFSGAHDQTVQRVLSGKADAGVLNSAIFNRLIQEGRVDPKQVRGGRSGSPWRRTSSSERSGSWSGWGFAW